MSVSLISDERAAELVHGFGWRARSRLDVVVERDGSYYVYNEQRTRALGGPYRTRAEAERRIAQIEWYKRSGRRDTSDPPAAAHATARHVAIHRAIGIATRRRRLPKQQYPKALEASYGTAIVGLTGRVREAVRPLREALPGILSAAAAERRDASSDDLRRLLARARAAVDWLGRDQRDVEALARRFANETQTYQRIQLGRQVKAALGVDLFARDRRIPAVVDHFVGENVALIKSIPSNLLDDVEKIVTRAVTSGTPSSQVDDEIEQRFGVSERRARLIARDQIGKLYGQVNAYRQQDLGVTQFVWRTVEDERVRPEHEALDGRTFAYDDPPVEGLPGEPIQCRCSAEPVFDTIRGLADDLE